MNRLRVGVVGLGSHAQCNVLPGLVACDAVILVAVQSRRAALRERIASQYGCRAFATYDDLLASDIDVAYVALPVGLHADATRRTLLAGKHVWCEKSLTTDLGLADELISLARTRELALFECYMFPHHPQWTILSEWLRGGQIGRACSISARFGFPHLSADNVRYRPELGGGALWDAGGYPLLAARLLGGEPTVLTASMNQDEGYDVDTGGAAFLRFASGTTAFVEWGFGRSYRNELEIWGEKGMIRAERVFSRPASLPPTLTLTRDTGELVTADLPPCNHFVNMMSEFARATVDVRKRAAIREDVLSQAALQARVRAAYDTQIGSRPA